MESQLRDIGYSTHTDNFMATRNTRYACLQHLYLGSSTLHTKYGIKYQSRINDQFRTVFRQGRNDHKNTRIVAFETKTFKLLKFFSKGLLTKMSPARKYLQALHFSCYIKNKHFVKTLFHLKNEIYTEMR